MTLDSRLCYSVIFMSSTSSVRYTVHKYTCKQYSTAVGPGVFFCLHIPRHARTYSRNSYHVIADLIIVP